MTDFIEKLPQWDKQGIEPPNSKKTVGWQADERPPADYMNWFQNQTFKALQELQQNATNKQDFEENINQVTSKFADIAINVKNFGAVGDGIADDTTAIQNAVNSLGLAGGTIILPPKTPGTIPVYRTTAKIIYPPNCQPIRLFSLVSAIIKADHNGDCLDISAQNENYSGHILEGVILQGPNQSYPASGYVPPSNGAGIKMVSAYGCVLRDVIIQGFKYGQYLKTGVKNSVEGKSYLRFNQYGVYIDGGATNANYWAPSVRVRENRKAGIYFNTGLAPFPTHNIIECLVETNIPYPYVPGGNAPNDSVGIYLGGAYYNIFDKVYSENHQYAVWITGSSDGNKFNKGRFSPSGDLTRLDKIMFDGPGVSNHTFSECVAISQDTTSPNVESNNASQLNNQFINCEGFTFIPASILAPLDIINNRPNQAGMGTPFGGITMPSYGAYNNPGEGSARGGISGIGTATATLNASGFGEIQLGSLINAATTITGITGLRKGQLFVLTNYQTTYPVTIKSSIDGISGIVLKNWKDCVLKNYSDSITFYVTQLGKIVEVGRNIKSLNNSTNNTPGTIANGSRYLINLPVVGAVLGDYVQTSFDKDLLGCSISAYVSAADTVTVILTNNTGASVTIPNGYFRVKITND